MIEIAVNEEQITVRQREIIRNKAISLSEDPDEAELLLDLSVKKKQVSTEASVSLKDNIITNTTVTNNLSSDLSNRTDFKELLFYGFAPLEEVL